MFAWRRECLFGDIPNLSCIEEHLPPNPPNRKHGLDGAWVHWVSDVQALIREFGRKLEIKEEKCAVFVYRPSGAAQTFTKTHGKQGENGLEYLGFRFDGRKVYLRDSTLSGLRRKVAFAARRDANICANENPAKTATDLMAIFNYERLIKRFGKVEDFAEKREDFRNWTFWTYARRAADTFGPLGTPILGQLKRHAALVRQRSDQELAGAVERRAKRATTESSLIQAENEV
jgi:hypothetical protein